MRSDDEIVQQIEQIEQQLKQLRIDLNERKRSQGKRKLKVGDSVIILNPNPNQEKEGIVSKINTFRVTVKTSHGNISRAPKNLTLK